ncbi:hypothetical protein [Desulforamulus hydrothermalis]|nr:hypothetical protein [Desulforamulus hydrothermalis]
MHSIAQKKTQPIKPCGARLYELLGGNGYVSVGEGRKHMQYLSSAAWHSAELMEIKGQLLLEIIRIYEYNIFG